MRFLIGAGYMTGWKNNVAQCSLLVTNILFILLKKLLSVPGRPAAVIPVFNIPREDFCLRTEAVFLFKRFHLDSSYFTFVEEIDLQNLLETKRLQLVLVDHNILAQRQKLMDVAVTEVLGRCTYLYFFRILCY